VRNKSEEREHGKSLARGMGSTKKNAEQDAARRALERLQVAAKKAADSKPVEEDAAEQ